LESAPVDLDKTEKKNGSN